MNFLNGHSLIVHDFAFKNRVLNMQPTCSRVHKTL